MYLYSCSCGESFAVSPAHAGQTTQCPHCNESVTLPKLGDLKQLPLAEEDRPDTTGARSWGVGQGLVFSLSAAALLAFLIMGIRCTYGWTSIPVPETVQDVIDKGHSQIDVSGPMELLQFWVIRAESGLKSRQVLTVEQTRAVRNGWKRWAFVSYGGMAICALGIWLSLPRRGRKNDAA